MVNALQLILYYLVFAVVPTLMLYGIGLALFWLLLLPLLGKRGAMLGAAGVLLAIAIVTPFILNRGAAVEEQAHPPDQDPTGPIAISGDIFLGNPAMLASAIDRRSLPEDDYRRPNLNVSCDELCTLLLATNSVRSVTSIDDKGFASTYVLADDSECMIDPARDLRMAGNVQWRKKYRCLVETNLVRTPDLSIETTGESHMWVGVYPASRMQAPRDSSSTVIMRGADGTILLRVTQPRLIGYLTPLSYCWSLELNYNHGLCASETNALRKSKQRTQAEIVAEHSNLIDPSSIKPI